MTLLAFVLVIWIGRRYASMEALEEGPDRTKLEQRLKDLDNSWPLVVIAFRGTAIPISWMLIPAGT